MTTEEFSRLLGELEGPVSDLDQAFRGYASAPSEETAAELETAGERYGAVSEGLRASLMPQLQEGADPDAATLLVALVGLDVSVATNASEVASLVQEPDESLESDEPPELRSVTEDEFDAEIQVKCGEIYSDVIRNTQPGAESFPDDAPQGPGNPHFSVASDVDAVLSRAAEDIAAVLLAGGQIGTGQLAAGVYQHLPTSQLVAQLRHIPPRVIQWWRVCRRLAVRGWNWVASKLSGLIGPDTLVNAIGGTLRGLIQQGARPLVHKSLARLLDAEEVTTTCDLLLSNGQGREAERARAARDVVMRHGNTREWIPWVTRGLGPLAGVGIAIGGLNIAILLAITLLLVSYLLAYDFLDSKAFPHPPDLFKGIRRAVAQPSLA